MLIVCPKVSQNAARRLSQDCIVKPGQKSSSAFSCLRNLDRKGNACTLQSQDVPVPGQMQAQVIPGQMQHLFLRPSTQGMKAKSLLTHPTLI